MPKRPHNTATHLKQESAKTKYLLHLREYGNDCKIEKRGITNHCAERMVC